MIYILFWLPRKKRGSWGERGIDFYSLSLQDTNQQTIVTDWSLDSNNLMIYGLIQNSNANLRIFVTSSPSLHFSVCSPPLQTTGFVSSQCERTDNIVDASNQFCENIDQDQRKCHYRFDVHETIKYPDDSNQKIFDQYIVSGTVEITIFEHFEDSANYCHSNWS